VISIDASVLVRFLVNDNADQFARAKTLIADNRIFVSSSVLVETEWALRNAYEIPKARILDALRQFLSLEQVTPEDAGAARSALAWAGEGMDFADALHLACSRPCRAFASFDTRLVRRAAQLDVLPVIAP
jgi:predicted nucleic-acid-binding protein